MLLQHLLRITWLQIHDLQAIQEQMRVHGQEPVSFQDVKDEIFDMVRPADPYKITLQDLITRFLSSTLDIFTKLYNIARHKSNVMCFGLHLVSRSCIELQM